MCLTKYIYDAMKNYFDVLFEFVYFCKKLKYRLKERVPLKHIYFLS